jgi:hypothetical protein
VRILFLPPDGRPCSTALPLAAAATASHELRLPPAALLGGPGRPADVPALLEFVRREGPAADAVVASLDLLAYGGLHASRDPAIDLDTALANVGRALEALRPVADALTSFASIPGAALGCSSERQLPAWRALVNYTTLRGAGAAPQELDSLLARIPASHFTDYEFVRRRNFRVLREFAEAHRRGAARRLAFVRDAPEAGGPSEAEVAELRSLTEGLDAPFLSGADGAAAFLVAAAVLDEAAPVLRLGVLVSDAPGMGRQALYEREPFRETFHALLRPLGFVVDNEDPEIHLCLHTPSARPRDLFLDEPPETAPALDEFVARVCQGISEGRTLLLADCAHVHGADPLLMDALPRVTLGGLAGFGAFGTSSDALASVLANAAMIAWSRRQREWNAPASIQWARRSLLDDWLYQSIARRQLSEYCQRRGVDRFAAGAAGAELDDGLNHRLKQLARARLPFGAPRFRARLPWARLTEVEIEWR